MLVGRMGLSPEYVLHEMTIKESNLIYSGWYDKYKMESDNNRLICYYSYLASYNRNDNKSIFDFMPFPWDKKVKDDILVNNTKISNREEFEAMKALVTN